MTGLTGLLRASLAGALLLCAIPSLAAPLCPADHIDEQVRVASMPDGDTLRLSDGRRVRLIGINTPEVAHDGRPAEPLAEEAHALLQRLVREADGRLGLRLGEEPRDHYGRLLAHVYLPDGESIEARLLAEGLATRVAIPPNLWDQACLARVENTARAAGRGLWALPPYRTPIDSRRLPADAQGYMLLQGRVERVGGSRHAQWINLEGGVALRVDHDLLPWFEGLDIQRLQGKRVEVRGWLTRPGDKEPRIRLTHPSMLRILD
ncbi:thermonuclease family protein [Thiofaba sp. EF100]|uniref:thermonuclease family protein n=1 Tax=Thiofaba sp. EF100 TaxID=3121274 RepID=UPI003221D7E4